MALRTIDTLELAGRRTFIRVDFNVPLEHSRITDATRIEAALPTIRLAIERRARIVLASHLGRPKGKADPALSLAPVATALAGLLGRPAPLAPGCVGPAVERAVAALGDGDVLLLENLRYEAGEERNDSAFARQLAGHADVYVNDAFGAAHRAHASTEGIAHHVRDKAAGLLMQREVEALAKVVTDPARPVAAVLGGAKVSDKIKVIEQLRSKVDVILIGGAMAYTFLRAQGLEIGDSLVEDDRVGMARDLLAAGDGARIELPSDHVVTTDLSGKAPTDVVGPAVPAGKKGVDIGPATVARYREALAGARTIFWNGPMGIFEVEAFSRGTMAVANAVADADALSVVGGGDSIAALARSGRSDDITHVSTGGGASLEFLEGRVLPGLAVLEG